MQKKMNKGTLMCTFEGTRGMLYTNSTGTVLAAEAESIYPQQLRNVEALSGWLAAVRACNFVLVLSISKTTV